MTALESVFCAMCYLDVFTGSIFREALWVTGLLLPNYDPDRKLKKTLRGNPLYND